MTKEENSMWIFEDEAKQYRPSSWQVSAGPGGPQGMREAQGIANIAAGIAMAESKIKQMQNSGGQAIPVHTYQGSVEVTDGSVILNGADVKNNIPLNLEITFANIKHMSIGYDRNYPQMMTNGIPERALAPLKLEFLDSGKKRAVYIFTNFSSATGAPTTDNQQIFAALKAKGIKTGFHL